jgi:prepilin-type N-terminal cleavage/methylation domain-containing protein
MEINPVAAVYDRRGCVSHSSAGIDRRYRAFTLIELLVVIVIIAVLMGIAFPVFSTIQNQARKTQAKNDVTQIVTAVNAFYTEYGRYPTTETTDDKAIYGTTNNSGTLFTELRGKSGSLNTRLIVFINPVEDTQQTNPKGKIGKDGQFYDPWGSSYSLQMDADYDNEVPNPYGADKGAGPARIRQGVISWSLGKNGVLGGGLAGSGFSDESGRAGAYTGSGDVISWQ